MPQASNELREIIDTMFGSIDTIGPIKCLEEAGYTLLEPSYFWRPPPNITSYEQMEPRHWHCLLFLCDEWDFGGFEPKETV